MSNTVISIENISKSYQLGAINTGTFRGDLQRWWARTRGLPDPYLKIGDTDHGNRQGETLWALKDINFQVQRGEALGIIGRNGAGKSTLLKILSRVTAPTSGEVKVKGRIASLLEVGTGFHPELTGRENVFLNGAIMGMDRTEIQSKFDEIVDFSGVEQFIDTPVKRYSSGMYVRLAFAVAAHLDPEILVVDEVLAVGDAEFQKKCLGKMGDVASEGRTVLFVSHNMGAIANLCKSAILLKDGRIDNLGVTKQVIERYLNVNTNTSSSVDFSEKIREGKKAFFLNVEILRLDGSVASEVSLMDGFILQLKYKIVQPIKGIKVSFRLRNFSGVYVLGSSDIDLNPIENLGQLRNPGTYTIQCKIDRQFLRPGRYSIDLWVGYPGIQTIDEYEQAILFDVIDTGSVESLIGEGSLSVLNPPLSWSTILENPDQQREMVS
jgi:lipopolysaccharide transport system ATP-binding protein